MLQITLRQLINSVGSLRVGCDGLERVVVTHELAAGERPLEAAPHVTAPRLLFDARPAAKRAGEGCRPAPGRRLQ